MLFTGVSLLALTAVVSAADHAVDVGAGGLTFTPEFVNADVGDRVIFTFRAKNHTLTQTSFGNVCHPLEGGFDSGFQPVAAETAEADLPVVVYEVTTGRDTPLWFYCAQKGHCGQGMVFSINCPFGDAPNSLENFQRDAREFGAYESASASWAATATSDVYGGYTYAPVYHPVVTETVTLGEEVWTTTYESYPNSPDPTPDAAEGVVHRVKVGVKGDNNEAALVYDPPAIAAAPRDTVIFEFHAKNHTVTQSSFGNPCRKLEFTSTTGQVGFDSGFIPVDASLTEGFPTYTITVNDTAPIWAYCRQGNHCGSGMVFSINADETSDRNHESFVALAQTINGTAAAPNPSTTGSVTDNGAAFSSATVNAAALVMMGLGSLFTLL